MTAIVPFASAQPVDLSPPHIDYAEDMNGNGFYDLLVVDAVVNVTTPGQYYIIGDLYDSLWNSIGYDECLVYLDIGMQDVLLEFSGKVIYLNGVDGPYTVELGLYEESSLYSLDFDTHNTEPYKYDEFEPPGAQFSPPYSDTGEDTNGNGLYDLLVVNVVVNVTTPGWYYMVGELYDSTWNSIGYDDWNIYLDVGMNEVPLEFSGGDIYLNGVDGPYIVDLVLADNQGSLLDNDTYITSSYMYIEFEPPDAIFSPPFSDYGVDEDGDGLYDFLVIQVPVEVNTAGNFSIYSELYDASWSYIDFDIVSTHLSVGTHILELRYYGPVIFSKGVDGPYIVEAGLFDESYALLDWHHHDTNAYAHSQFENSGAIFGQIHSDYPLDLDANGLYDLLVVEVAVDVLTSGWYLVSADLLDTSLNYVDFDLNSTYLDAGPRIVNLEFSGQAIYSTGVVDSPFNVMLNLFDSSSKMLDEDIYVTGSYNATDFEHGSPPVAIFTASPLVGNKSTIFTFDPSASYDAEDPYSSLEGRWDWDGGNWDTPWAPLSVVTHTYAADGNYTVRLQVRDTLGLLDIATVNITVDSVAPMTSSTLSGTTGQNGWYVSDVTVTMSATDPRSGVNYTLYRIDGGAWQTYSAPFELSQNGTHILEYYSTDVAGNEESVRSVEVKIDTSPPSLVITEADNVTFAADSAVIHWSMSDAVSGIADVMISVDGATFQSLGNVTSIALEALEVGEHTVVIRILDKAGLMTEKTLHFKVEEGAGAAALDWPLVIGIMAAVIAAIIATLLLMKRPKKPVEKVHPRPEEKGKGIEEELPPPPPDL